MDRRGFLGWAAALLAAPRAFARPAPRIAVRGLNHVTIVVRDLQQSADFYQGLFGFARERRARTFDAGLRIGPGAGMDLTTDRPDRTPRLDHFCFGVDGFAPAAVVKTLAAHGIAESDTRGTLQVQVSTRDGATLVYVGDPDGIPVQLQDPGYCGGTGVLGNDCPEPAPPPHRGLIRVSGYAAVSLRASDARRTATFYRDLFGPGNGIEISAGPPGIQSFAFAAPHFDVDTVAKALDSYGAQPRVEGRGVFFTDAEGVLGNIRSAR